MPPFFSYNGYLTQSEMETNAIYIYTYLIAHDWTPNAIAGMIGNMETESRINPGIWEDLDIGNMSKGYGLVQWTPASKYIDWAIAKGYDYSHMDSNILRILHEVEINTQWGNDSLGNPPPFNFEGFTVSQLPPYDLGILFLHHYEKPAIYDQPLRGEQAEAWFEFFGGVIPSVVDPISIINLRRIHHRRRR